MGDEGDAARIQALRACRAAPLSQSRNFRQAENRPTDHQLFIERIIIRTP